MINNKLKIRFNKVGLVPAVIQDYKTKDVYMVGYMNSQAFGLTKKTGRVHFYSRSRKKIWLKGEKSGNFQIVKSIYFDCDADAVLVKIKQVGNAACHTGYKSCFYRKLDKNRLKLCGRKVFNPKEVYK